LALTKHGSPNPITVGTNLTYMLAVTNGGPSQATHVTITDTLPGLVTFVPGLSSSTCNLTGGVTVTCNIGSVSFNQTVIAIIVVSPTQEAHGRITNTATVSADQTDPNPANNSASETTTVRHGPPVKLLLSPSSETIKAGQGATFAVTLARTDDTFNGLVSLSCSTGVPPCELLFILAINSDGWCHCPNSSIGHRYHDAHGVGLGKPERSEPSSNGRSLAAVAAWGNRGTGGDTP